MIEPKFQYSAQVTRVVDGDTVDLLIDLGFSIKIKERVRLLGVDAPESRTRNLDEKNFGLEAKEWLIAHLSSADNKIVVTTQYDRAGKFGRTLAVLWAKGVDLNALMLSTGYATPYFGQKKEPWEVRKAVLLEARSLL